MTLPGFGDQPGFAELVLPFDPGAAQARLARRRRLLWMRLAGLVVTVAVLAGLYVWQRDGVDGPVGLGLYGLVLGISVAWVVGTLVGYLQARSRLSAVRPGIAVRVGPAGVEVAGLALAWPEVASLGTVSGGLGRPARLRLTALDGRTSEVTLEQVPVFPATLDSTARAFSGGRHGVDLGALDH